MARRLRACSSGTSANQNRAILISRIDKEKLPTIEAFITYCQNINIDFDIAGKDETGNIITELLIKKYNIPFEKFIGNVNTIDFLIRNKDKYLFVGGVGQVAIEAGILGFPVLCLAHLGVEYSTFITKTNFSDFQNFTIRNRFNYKQILNLDLNDIEKYSINALICKNLDIEKFFKKYYELLNT